MVLQTHSAVLHCQFRLTMAFVTIVFTCYLISVAKSEIFIHQFVTESGYKDVTISVEPFQTQHDVSLTKCTIRCSFDDRCKSVSMVKNTDGSTTCNLFDSNLCSGDHVYLIPASNSTLYDKTEETDGKSSCYLGRCLAENGGQCEKCNRPMYYGSLCQYIDLCPPRYQFYAGSCYVVVQSPLENRSGAENSCRDNYFNGHLAPIRNSDVNQWLTQWLNELNIFMAYFGANNLTGSYTDGENRPIPIGDEADIPGAPFTWWLADKPRGAIQSPVVLAYESYYWDDHYSFQLYSYICESPSNSCIDSPQQRKGVDGTCYNIYNQSSLNFTQAKDQCEVNGGQLAAPKDMQTYYLLVELSQSSNVTAPIFIGVVASRTIANGVYLDGSPVPFQPPWLPGEPNFLTENVSVLLYSGFWSDWYPIQPNCYICEYIASDCWEWRLRGHTNSGKYRVKPDSEQPSVDVNCDMVTDGKGWTIIQSRKTMVVDFNRNKIEYASGFGDLDTEFWLGNEMMHQLTRNVSSQLLIEMGVTGDSNSYQLRYFHFHLGNESTGFTLYSDTAVASKGIEDVLSDLSGSSFSSCHDGDTHPCCDPVGGGGWWFPSNNNCIHTNLNGKGSDMQWNNVSLAWVTIKLTRN